MIRRILGWLGVVLGGIGILLSVVGIVATLWVSSIVITQVVPQVFAAVEQALVFGDEVATQLTVLVNTTEARLATITRLSTMNEDAPLPTALAIELADEIATIQQLAATADQVLTTIEPILSLFAPTNELAMTLREAIDTLNSTEALVQQLQAGRTEMIAAIDGQLENLTVRGTALQNALAQAQDTVIVLQQRVLRGIYLGVFAVTIIFVWFGAAQYTLIRSSWRLAHATLQPKGASA
jgi:hypothetical protein